MTLFQSLTHPGETLALIKYKLLGSEIVKQRCDYGSMNSGLQRCYEYLTKRSKNFAAVISSLGGEIGNDICVFYLILRALDTVEDDMTIPNDIKLPMLKDMHMYLQDPTWNYTESKDKDRIVLAEFPILSREFRNMSPALQNVLSETIKEMGSGMAKYIEKSVDTIEDLDEYCYYVAGLTGTGWAGTFVTCALEDEKLCHDKKLAVSMGTFLQKTNIICDCLEDLEEGRGYWPKEVWEKYGNNLTDLTKTKNRENAILCLNELITDALRHIPNVMTFLSMIKHNRVKSFMTIPQMVAIARLERSYNNPLHFVETQKIRKGQTIQIINNSRDIESVKAVFYYYLNKIYKRILASDPNAERTRSACMKAMVSCRTSEVYDTGLPVVFYVLLMSIVVFLLAVYFLF